MNGPLHVYLANLVVNAEQLIITADNAKIPIENPSHCGDDVSMHSCFTHYSHNMDGSYTSVSTASTMNSSTNSTRSSNSNRWASETSPHPEKDKILRKPPRRSLSGSPPPSRPTYERRLQSDDDSCLPAASSFSPEMIAIAARPISLVGATSQGVGKLRKPQRQNSITKMPTATTSRGRRRSKAGNATTRGGEGGGGTEAIPKGRRFNVTLDTLRSESSSTSPASRKKQHSTRNDALFTATASKNASDQNNDRKESTRKVSMIIGDAIRELGLTDDDIIGCERSSLALHYIEPAGVTGGEGTTSATTI